MSHLTRYGRRIKLTLVKAVSVTCLFCLFYIPFIEDKMLSTDVGYYTVVLNGIDLGAVNSVDEANQAFTNARLQLSKEHDSVVYMAPEFEVYEQSRLVGTRMSKSDIENEIYKNLASSIVDLDKQEAYTVRINDFTVTLSSKDDVVKLIEGVKKNYDGSNEFQVTLDPIDDIGNEYSVNMVKSGIGANNNDIVAATLNGTVAAAKTGNAAQQDGLTNISFAQEVTINLTTASTKAIYSVEDALAEVTKEKEGKTIYTVEAGDCLSTIAAKNNIASKDIYALNEGLTEDSVIMPGDPIVITVPTSELSVMTTERVTYEEDYNAQVQYVDNDSLYRGTSNVIQSGSDGHRKVTADITYMNGVENDRNYVQETVIVESVPKIVEVGTLTPPTYVKPISGGSFSSAFEYRWGAFHAGIDWSCPPGTRVMASAAGTVVRAGWYSDYGYCVDIQHPNGVLTRYAHNSRLAVTVGQKVNQNDTIAYSGNTGNSTGPHVHFEIRINGTAVNPLNYVNKY